MGRSEWEDRCKRHPEHRTSRGVCPFCLRDRLAQLSASSSAATTATRASSTSAATSPSYSSASSPPPPPRQRHGDVSSVHVVHAADSFVNVSAFSQPLMPTAAAIGTKPTTTTMKEAADAHHGGGRGKGEEDEEEVRKKKKKSGKRKKIGRFLSRLVGAEKRRQTGGDGDAGELFHSKTMKEKTASKWVFF